jgi:transposase
VDIESLDPPIKDYIFAFKSEADAKIQMLEKQVALLLEELRLARHTRFGRSSEQLLHEQVLPFPEGEQVSVDPAPLAGESVTVAEHTRRKGGRKPLAADLPRVESLFDIDEADKLCACGSMRTKIGEERCEKLHHIPEKYFVEVQVRPYYACKKCDGSSDDHASPIRVAKVPATIIPKGIATADLLASIIVNKFCDHLPFHRQEQRLSRMGVSISRTDMANWTIKAGRAVQPVLDLLCQKQRSGAVINMDETPVTVMGEEGKSNSAKSYVWLMRGGKPDMPIITYHYRTSHAATEARQLLAGFSGFLQTDGLDSYPPAIAGTPIIHVGCWAHARRRFHEADKASPKAGIGKEGLDWIWRLYAIERELRKDLKEGKITREQFKRDRIEKTDPVFKDFKEWLLRESLKVLPSGLAGKAISYTLGQWDTLVRYSAHADLTPDNNAAENSIRPFVLGRKNWMICGSPDGATYASLFYSLIETAKANDIDPFNYLMTLFHFAPSTKSTTDWARLLPLKGTYNPPGPVTIPVPPGLF